MFLIRLTYFCLQVIIIFPVSRRPISQSELEEKRDPKLYHVLRFTSLSHFTSILRATIFIKTSTSTSRTQKKKNRCFESFAIHSRIPNPLFSNNRLFFQHYIEINNRLWTQIDKFTCTLALSFHTDKYL